MHKCRNVLTYPQISQNAVFASYVNGVYLLLLKILD